jgi:hypothetical protein
MYLIGKKGEKKKYFLEKKMQIIIGQLGLGIHGDPRIMAAAPRTDTSNRRSTSSGAMTTYERRPPACPEQGRDDEMVIFGQDGRIHRLVSVFLSLGSPGFL